MRFATIFSPGVIKAVTAERFDQVIANSSGVGIALGRVWFSGLYRDRCNRVDIRVIAVNGDRERAETQRPSKGRI
jgi:hypothetical protein